MLSTSWTAAPAGFLGTGSADVRPYAVVGTAVRPVLSGAVVPVQGTGVPTAVRRRATGLFATGMPDAKQLPPTTQQFAPITPNDGTTLGYHFSRRPQS